MARAVKWIVFSTVSLLAASAAMIGVRAVLARVSPPEPTPAVARVAGAGPTIERVRELSALTTLRIDVADAFVTELRGRTGGTTAVLVCGQVAIGVEPQVQFARLDHERTKLVGVWAGGLWMVVPGGRDADAAAVNAGYREAQRAARLPAAPDVLEGGAAV